jgi:AraC family transcriptional regulator of adaptative response / DNA-3-methyladenine glycosylase II
LRRAGGAQRGADTGLRLAYRPPYDHAAMLGFWARRQLPGVEQVEGLTLRRTLAWPYDGATLTGWVAVSWLPERHEVQVQAAPGLGPVLGAVLQRVRHALDLDADPALTDPVLARLPLPARPGLRLPGSLDGFETAVRVVLGQQVTVKAARTLTQRLVQCLGRPLATPHPGLDRLFPDAATLASASADTIGRLGIVRQRVGALQALATAVAEGQIALHPGAPLQATLAALRALPGIGDWTAQVIALRVLAWPDAWPATDVGLMNALGTRNPAQLLALAEPWRPWRSYALMRLWHLVETDE